MRGGVINGDVGLGLDAYAGKRFVFSVDAMDPNDPALRLGAQYQLNDAGTWLMGQWDDVNDSDKRAPTSACASRSDTMQILGTASL